MANRIHILNWRGSGDDESNCLQDVFADGEESTVYAQAEEMLSPGQRDSFLQYEPDAEHPFYINDDIEIADGQVLTSQSSGRKFRVTITEEIK